MSLHLMDQAFRQCVAYAVSKFDAHTISCIAKLLDFLGAGFSLPLILPGLQCPYHPTQFFFLLTQLRST